MSKHKSIWNKLTKKELVHIIENALVNDPLKAFQETRKAQLRLEAANGEHCCWECTFIAKKLGIK